MIGLFFVLAIFVTLSFGGFLSSEMMMDGNNMMMPCPFMGTTGICNMTPLEHLGGWQQMFTSIQTESFTLALILLLALTVIWGAFTLQYIPKIIQYRVLRHRYRERVFDPLRLAFARGILHSKAY